MDIKKAFDGYKAGKYTEYLKAWNWKLHDVFDEKLRPKDKIIVRDESWENGTLIPARLEDMEVNRIAYPIEQDIVNKHVAFTVGREPILEPTFKRDTDRLMFELLEDVHHDNKMKYINRKVLRSWLSETLVAEYWWRDPETGDFKVEVWSPFRGDKLVPEHNTVGKLVGFYRFYTTKDDNGRETQWGMHIDNLKVSTYRQERGQWEEVPDRTFDHGFSKLPVIYIPRDAPLCDKIKTIRARVENIWSNAADCNDYHYAPKQIATGDIEVKNSNPKGRNKIIKLEKGGDMKYLTWQQSPEMVKTEYEMLEDAAYRMTNTPRMSPSEMASTGATSGEAFKYVFASIGLAVEEHEEEFGEFLQRRINFLLHAIATAHPELKESEYMRVTPRLVPYSINTDSEEKSNNKKE